MYYRTYSDYLKTKYGEKVYKLPVNLPISCPNRMNGMGGCTFCADVGTGFEAMAAEISVTEQLERTKEKISKRYKANKFIAYFQNYTNTFMSFERFQTYMMEAAQVTDIVEISISTRPDCIKREYLDFLFALKKDTKINIHFELGLQTVNYHTLKQINRGHGLGEFIQAVLMIQRYGFTICTHMILNLPGDTLDDAIEGAKFLSALEIDIVKLHSLYLPKNSQLYTQYINGTITLCSKEEYLERLTEFLAYLSPEMVVERLFSRVPEEYAGFSNWGTSWWKLRDEFEELMKKKNYTQGCRFHYLNGAALNRWELE
ncbi:MAG: TIGR01212 family radical SAM protein [Lachnospiraceae bacterium]|nr:TIGR01212 family radical SAM protein [Lachnospiraceae bacterium]